MTIIKINCGRAFVLSAFLFPTSLAAQETFMTMTDLEFAKLFSADA